MKAGVSVPLVWLVPAVAVCIKAKAEAVWLCVIIVMVIKLSNARIP